MKNTKMKAKISEPIKNNGSYMDDMDYPYTASSQHTDKLIIPFWKKVTLTIQEAASYSNIGIAKIYEMTNDPMCNFVLHVGSRKRLIKRKEFEIYISQSIEI